MSVEPSLYQRISKEYRDMFDKLFCQGQRHLGVDPHGSMVSYEGSFPKAIGTYAESVSEDQVIAAARDAQIVYVGDFHPLQATKKKFRDIVERARDPAKKIVILLEEFTAGPVNDRLAEYLTNRISEADLKDCIWGHEGTGTWKGMMLILRYAKELARTEKDIAVYGIDVRYDSVRARTGYLEEQIREIMMAPQEAIKNSVKERQQAFVLVGDFHLNPLRLPAAFQNTTSCTILQGPEEMFWQLQEQGILWQAEAVKTTTGIYCLNMLNPLWRTMVQNNMNNAPGDKLKQSELKVEYKQQLIEILSKAFGESGGAIDPESIEITALERAVFDGTLTDEERRAQWNEFFPKE